MISRSLNLGWGIVCVSGISLIHNCIIDSDFYMTGNILMINCIFATTNLTNYNVSFIIYCITRFSLCESKFHNGSG